MKISKLRTGVERHLTRDRMVRCFHPSLNNKKFSLIFSLPRGGSCGGKNGFGRIRPPINRDTCTCWRNEGRHRCWNIIYYNRRRIIDEKRRRQIEIFPDLIFCSFDSFVVFVCTYFLFSICIAFFVCLYGVVK